MFGIGYSLAAMLTGILISQYASLKIFGSGKITKVPAVLRNLAAGTFCSARKSREILADRADWIIHYYFTLRKLAAFDC